MIARTVDGLIAQLQQLKEQAGGDCPVTLKAWYTQPLLVHASLIKQADAQPRVVLTY